MRLASRTAKSTLELDINRFVLEHGRLPFLSDPVPPWHYRGWLLFQVQIADHYSGATGRWDHYMRTLEAGRLLDEPIPRVHFREWPAADGVKMLERCVDLLAYRESQWSAFEVFVQWLAWGLSVSRNKPAMEEASSEALYRLFNSEPLLLHPPTWDTCSRSGEARDGTRTPTSRTSHAVCELMAQITFGGGENDSKGGEDPRLRLICEPARLGQVACFSMRAISPIVSTGWILIRPRSPSAFAMAPSMRLGWRFHSPMQSSQTRRS